MFIVLTSKKFDIVNNNKLPSVAGSNAIKKLCFTWTFQTTRKQQPDCDTIEAVQFLR